MKKPTRAPQRKPEAHPKTPDVVSLPYRRALKQLDLPPDVIDPPPLEVLEQLVELKKQGLLKPEFVEEVVASARKHGKKYGFRL